MKKLAIIIIVLGCAVGLWAALHQSHAATRVVQRTTKSTPKKVAQPAGFNKMQYSLTDPTSTWVIVNKQRPLQPNNYVPSDLVVPKVPLRLSSQNATMQVRQVTATAMEAMFAAAKQNGTPLKLSSGYRSYTYQVSLYNGYVKDQGQSDADAQSARPGYSEHQTGLAADLEPLDDTCEVQTCFATTPAGEWLATNSYKYGFIIRYGKDDTAETGYEYEPWHVRYVGIPLATELHNQHVTTLEQYFGTGSAAHY